LAEQYKTSLIFSTEPPFLTTALSRQNDQCTSITATLRFSEKVGSRITSTN